MHTTNAIDLQIGDIVIVDGSDHRVMFAALAAGTNIELTLKSTTSRLSPEFKRTFRKYEALLTR